jgi:hypothetical protein
MHLIPMKRLIISSKQDTRKFGFSLNYKIPKNKLAKEGPSL